MNIETFAEFQRSSATSFVGALVSGCKRKFVASARLLEWSSPILTTLETFGEKKSIDVWQLLSSFEILCVRYQNERYSPQSSLFPEPDRAPDELWQRYYYWILLPHLLQSDTAVRNVLRAVGALPTADTKLVTAAIRQHFSDMTLPNHMPLWAPEDVPTHR